MPYSVRLLSRNVTIETVRKFASSDVAILHQAAILISSVYIHFEIINIC